jgi:hypothetical protein
VNSIRRPAQPPAGHRRRGGLPPSDPAARRRAAQLLLAAACRAEDAEVVAKLCDGDLAALEVLWRRYARAVFLRCWLVLRDRQPAWEATQDTFLAFVAHLPCTCGQPARDWLFTTCGRVAAEHPTAPAAGERSC